MTSLAQFHADFARAVAENDPGALAGHVAPRFVGRGAVYRNNAYASAVGALASSFPAVAGAAGAVRFRTLAARYVTLRPPRPRSLVGYGRDFALVLREAREPDAAMLSDLARLDRAWLEAHLAADDEALTAEALGALAPEAVVRLKPALRASVRFTLVAPSAFDRWCALREGAAPSLAADEDCPPVAILFWRPRGEVVRRRLADAEAQLLLGVAAGDPLGLAAQTATAADPTYDIAQGFAAALAAGVFASPRSTTEIPR